MENKNAGKIVILNSHGISHLSRANHKRGIIIEIRTSHITIRLNHFRNSDILAKNNSKNAKNSVKIGKKQKKGPNGTTKGSLVRVRSIGVKLMKLEFFTDFSQKMNFHRKSA